MNYISVLEEKGKLKEKTSNKEYLHHIKDLISKSNSEQIQKKYFSEIGSSIKNMKEIVGKLEDKMLEDFPSCFRNSKNSIDKI